MRDQAFERIGEVDRRLRAGHGLFDHLAGDGVDAAFERAGDDLVPLFAQNGDGLRTDQAGVSYNDNLHGLPRLSTIQSWNPGEKSPLIFAPT